MTLYGWWDDTEPTDIPAEYGIDPFWIHFFHMGGYLG